MKKLYWTGAVLAAGLTVAIAAGKPQFGTFGLDTTAMDLSVKPGDDFYDYANGAWQKKAVIPPERTGTGSFDDLQITSENRMKAIVADLEAKPQVTGEEK
jgi:putative endopeptidase